MRNSLSDSQVCTHPIKCCRFSPFWDFCNNKLIKVDRIEHGDSRVGTRSLSTVVRVDDDPFADLSESFVSLRPSLSRFLRNVVCHLKF